VGKIGVGVGVWMLLERHNDKRFGWLGDAGQI
jgi:hypothetical protein